MAIIARYYADKFAKFGTNPLGVDWTCEPSQYFRFTKLMHICGCEHAFSLNDVGCGYGALLDYLERYHSDRLIKYFGVDICARMVTAARHKWADRPNTMFEIADRSPETADVSIASGIFNVKLHIGDDAWERHIADVLTDIATSSRQGFAVNFVDATGYSRSAKAGLYRVEPDVWARYCTTALDCSVEIVSGYGMREFTLLAKKRTTPHPVSHVPPPARTQRP